MKLLIFFSLCFLGITMTISVAGQRLNIGEPVPDFEIKNVQNYKQTHFKFSDFKGKLIILDFFGVHCLGCVAQLPHMEEMQHEFGDKIQIILVTKNNKEEMQWLRTRTGILDKLHFPFVVGDTQLSNSFSVNLLPTHIWIDSNRKLTHKAERYYTTSENINKAISGKNVIIPEKNERDFRDSPLKRISGNCENEDQPQYYSCVTAAKSMQPGGKIIIDSLTRKSCGVIFLNQPVSFLFQVGFGKGLAKFTRNMSRTILEDIDSNLLYPPSEMTKFDQWTKEHAVCYQLQVPVSKSDQLYTIMQQDINRYFGYSGLIEKREVKCLVLTRTDTANKLYDRGNGPLIQINPEQTELLMKNATISDLLAQLELVNNGYGYPYFFDSTGYKKHFDITLDCDLSDPVSVNNALKEYGLVLKEEPLSVDMLVIRKTK